MARKLIATIQIEANRVRVYRDSDSDEFVARLDGASEADAFESFNRYDPTSIADARRCILDTARRMAEGR